MKQNYLISQYDDCEGVPIGGFEIVDLAKQYGYGEDLWLLTTSGAAKFLREEQGYTIRYKPEESSP